MVAAPVAPLMRSQKIIGNSPKRRGIATRETTWLDRIARQILLLHGLLLPVHLNFLEVQSESVCNRSLQHPLIMLPKQRATMLLESGRLLVIRLVRSIAETGLRFGRWYLLEVPI